MYQNKLFSPFQAQNTKITHIFFFFFKILFDRIHTIYKQQNLNYSVPPFLLLPAGTTFGCHVLKLIGYRSHGHDFETITAHRRPDHTSVFFIKKDDSPCTQAPTVRASSLNDRKVPLRQYRCESQSIISRCPLAGFQK